MPDEKASPEEAAKEIEATKEIEVLQDADGVERRKTLGVVEAAKEGEKISFKHGAYIVKNGVLFHAGPEEK